MSTWTTQDMPDQHGRTFVVTGANNGLGYETTRALAARGAEVVMACRNLDKAQRAAERIRAELPAARLVVLPLDLADLTSVRAFAAQVQQAHPELDGLINNAGVMFVPRTVTPDGFELTFATNHLGHFALTGLLLPALLPRPGARVVTVSSGGHRAGRINFDDLTGQRRYSRHLAYFQSKLANLLFTFELQRRLERAGSTVLAVAAHPGASATDLGKATPVQRRLFTLGERFFQSAAAGARPTLRAATDPGVQGADYFGPSGPLEMMGHPVRVGTARAARDEDVAQRLWDRSAALTGVDYAALLAAR